jgi:hypothetical protein
MRAELDDRTTAYVIAAHPHFEDLRQVAAQLAGLLVLAATGSRDSAPDHPMLSASKLALAKAADGVKRVEVPVTDSARVHHRELLHATAALELAVASADAWPIDINAVMGPLRDAYAHLQRAAAALPGFQIVSFEQACCGVVSSSTDERLSGGNRRHRFE